VKRVHAERERRGILLAQLATVTALRGR